MELRPIRLMKSTFYDEESTKEKLCKFIMSSERLSMAEKCLEFERVFAAKQGAKHAVAFNSGSSANLALIQALLNIGLLKHGDPVGFSAVTWSTNPMPLIQLGLEPVPIEIDPDTLNVSSETLKNCLSRTKLKGLFLTNLLGFCSDIDVIAAICRDEKIAFFEDNCESFGSITKGKKLGNFGISASFSTYVGHHLSTIEGGVCTTDDEEFHQMLLMARAHGWSRNLPVPVRNKLRKQSAVEEFYDQYTFYELGYNLRPTEITGFLGIEQVKHADEIVQLREKNFRRFSAAAAQNRSIRPLKVDHMSVVSNFAYPVVARDVSTRNALLNRFVESKVEVRPIVGGNMTRQPFFRKYCPKYADVKFSVSDDVHDLGFYFPNHPDLEESEIERMCSLLK